MKYNLFSNNNFQTNRENILKLLLGLGIIIFLFFISTDIAQKRFYRLSEKVSLIIEPNIKIIKLKEISNYLYEAESNVKSFAISQDTTYLIAYEKNIYFINSRIDTLFLMLSKGEIILPNEAKSKQIICPKI